MAGDAAPAPVTLYYDSMSQPSRAALILLQRAGYPHAAELALIHKRQHRAPGVLARNPLGRLPFLVTAGGETLVESHAIMRYLCATGPPAAAAWYPRGDALAAARVDAALDWHHTVLRRGAAALVFARVVGPTLGVEPAPGAAEAAEAQLRKALGEMDAVWLAGGGRAYLCGGSAPTIADLSSLCELDQLMLLGDMEARLAEYPAVARWAERTRAALEPQYSAATAVLRKAAARRAGKAKL